MGVTTSRSAVSNLGNRSQANTADIWSVPRPIRNYLINITLLYSYKFWMIKMYDYIWGISLEIHVSINIGTFNWYCTLIWMPLNVLFIADLLKRSKIMFYRITNLYNISVFLKTDSQLFYIILLQDAIPPAFDPSTCPENIVVSTDSTNNTALVKWDIPTGTDNSGDPVTVKEIHNLHPNTRFLAGTHLVRYTITDSAGNVGPSCGFSIKVQSKWYSYIYFLCVFN